MYKKLAAVISLCVLLSLALTGCVPIETAVQNAAQNASQNITQTAGRIVGSGNIVTRSYDIADFDAVSVSSAFKVTIYPGDRFIVEVNADDNLIDYVKVTKEGNTLTIRYDTHAFTSFSSRNQEVRMTMPKLTSIRLSGASQGTIQNGFVRVDQFEANLDGASKLAGAVQAGEYRLEASGASRYILNGSGGSLTLSASGASGCDLGDLNVDKANVRLSGASNASVHTNSSLSYSLSGASTLDYAGSPTIGSAETSGASRANKK